MGKKIFVSYKYADNRVENLRFGQNSTVRDYVTEFQRIVDLSDHIYKGEDDGEDLSHLHEETIWSLLRDRIYDSSVTVVFISPGMREYDKRDRDQWIPWEISYSLKETSRKTKNGNPITSHSNAMVAVILPDENGKYDYYLEPNTCCSAGCFTHHTERLFTILEKNMFNKIKNVNKKKCNNGTVVWSGERSYIESVKWSDFIRGYQYYINKAIERQKNIDEYEIRKEI